MPQDASSSASSTPVVVTPPSDSSPFPSQHSQRRVASPLRFSSSRNSPDFEAEPLVKSPSLRAGSTSRPTSRAGSTSRPTSRHGLVDGWSQGASGSRSPGLGGSRPVSRGSAADVYAEDPLDEDMAADRPAFNRPMDGKSSTPLLKDERGRSSYDAPNGSARPPFHARRATFRSRSPDSEVQNSTRKKYTYSAFFLGLSLVMFVVQTETAVYIQQTLGWDKPYCMLYLTHGSWSLLWPSTLLILRLKKWQTPWPVFWQRHITQIRTTAQMVRTHNLHLTTRETQQSPVLHMLKIIAFVTCALTIAGGSWYVAVNLTSSSDLTAIYNCSAFFAYAFSIPLLGDKLRFDKIFSVGIAIIGVLVVAYGDAADPADVGGGVDDEKPSSTGPKNRLVGNIIIGIGSVLYGLYEVLYKKLACPPEGTSTGRGITFAMAVGSMIGSFTLLVLWIPLPLLHVLGVEEFVVPTGERAWMMLISTLANATFSGSFLVLISLTSPVLSSVAALLTIFLVALVDWMLPDGKPLSLVALIGGLLIVAAFLLLSWSTYREMQEERRKRLEEDGIMSESDE